jgi:hypothetical protein
VIHKKEKLQNKWQDMNGKWMWNGSPRERLGNWSACIHICQWEWQGEGQLSDILLGGKWAKRQKWNVPNDLSVRPSPAFHQSHVQSFVPNEILPLPKGARKEWWWFSQLRLLLAWPNEYWEDGWKKDQAGSDVDCQEKRLRKQGCEQRLNENPKSNAHIAASVFGWVVSFALLIHLRFFPSLWDQILVVRSALDWMLMGYWIGRKDRSKSKIRQTFAAIERRVIVEWGSDWVRWGVGEALVKWGVKHPPTCSQPPSLQILARWADLNRGEGGGGWMQCLLSPHFVLDTRWWNGRDVSDPKRLEMKEKPTGRGV